MERFKVGKLAGYQSLSKPKSGGSVASSAQPLTRGSKDSGLAGSDLFRARLLLAAGIVAVIAAATWLRISWGMLLEKGHLRLHVTHTLTSAQAFMGGVLLASTFGCAGFGYAYRRFRETLKSKKEVFAYPATIPRRKR